MVRCHSVSSTQFCSFQRKQVYNTPLMSLEAAATGTTHGMPLRHVTFTVERNPFSELLEISGGGAYTPAVVVGRR